MSEFRIECSPTSCPSASGGAYGRHLSLTADLAPTPKRLLLSLLL